MGHAGQGKRQDQDGGRPVRQVARHGEDGDYVIQSTLATLAVLALAVAVVQAVMWRHAAQDAQSAAQQGAETAALADGAVDDGRDDALDAITRSLVRDPTVTAAVELDSDTGVQYAVVRVEGSSVRLLGIGFPIRETGRFPMEPR